MKHILANNPGEAWKKSVNLVYKKGTEIKDGDNKLIELLNVIITVKDPHLIDDVVKKHGDRKMIRWMKNNFLQLKAIENWGYSYGQRMYDFQGINQFQNIVKKLKTNSDTKSATISFMFPPKDKQHVPCIIALDLKIRKKILIGTAFFRSQDAGKKIYADILSLGNIMSKVANKLAITVGPLLLHIVSLHVYKEDIESLTKGRNSLLNS